MNKATAYRLGYALGMRKLAETPTEQHLGAAGDVADSLIGGTAGGILGGGVAGPLLVDPARRGLSRLSSLMRGKLPFTRGADAVNQMGTQLMGHSRSLARKLPMGLGILGATLGAVLPALLRRSTRQQPAVPKQEG